MRAAFFSITVLAAFVLEVNGGSTLTSTLTTTATTTTTTAECQAQSILDACLDTTQGYLSLCESQDWSCLCDKYNAIMTCFANCPNDSRQYDYNSQRQVYCANASAYPSSTQVSGRKTTSRSSEGPSSKTYAVATPTVDGDEDGDATGYPTYDDASSATAQALSTAAAVDIVGRGAGVLAAFAGVAAALL